MNEIRESSCKTHTPQCDCKWCNYVRGIEHDQETCCNHEIRTRRTDLVTFCSVCGKELGRHSEQESVCETL